MQITQHQPRKTLLGHLIIYALIAIGAFLAAFSIEVFLIPNNLIDGGIVGVAMICGNITSTSLIPYYLLAFNLPFLYLAYRFIGKIFVAHFFFAVILFAGWMIIIQNLLHWRFEAESLEVVVIGGAILGVGLGIIIRYGGCLDGTEILGIIVNRKTGFSVGQVVLFCNIFVFGAAGIAFNDWHPALLSLIMYMVVIKVMDSVIVGLDETKSVMIISSKSKEIADAIMHELGLGLTIMYGRGGFSGDAREILYVIAERLQLAELKEIIHAQDPHAFIAIENLHEVTYGNQGKGAIQRKNNIERMVKNLWNKRSEPTP
jgi:uncharacterized membrane-anchored protein YitT (DUF2179 family)